MDEERSLADVPVVDSTPVATPQDFNLTAFIEGVRPTRRSVQLFPRAHLIGELERIAAHVQAAAQDENVDALIDRFDQIKQQFEDGVWFTVEKRSSEWVDRFRATTAGRLGFRKDPDTEKLATDHELVITLHQLAEQVVDPKGLTYEHLRVMLDANEGELNKLVYTMIQVNTKLAQDSKVLTLDFSLRRSITPAT